MSLRARLGPMHHTACSRGGGRPSSSGVDHVFSVVVRVQPASKSGLLEVARHGVGCPTENCFTGGTISTIANHRQLGSAAPPSCSCLEWQPTAPSVRAMERRGLVNPPMREISVIQLPSAAARTQPSGVTSALSPCSSRTAICPRRYRRASRASRTFMLIVDLDLSL